MSSFTDGVRHKLPLLPSAACRGSTARTIENVFLKKADRCPQKKRSIGVRTKSNHISSGAIRTFNAMTDKSHSQRHKLRIVASQEFVMISTPARLQSARSSKLDRYAE